MRSSDWGNDGCVGGLRTAVLLILLLSLDAVAEIVETTVQMPVHIVRARQPDLRRNIVVTVLRDDKHQRGPVALLAHGRPVTAQDRARMGQVKYPGNALWLAQQGFVVVVPTRIGYGVSGGPDLDASGDCLDKNYLNALSGAVSQYRQVLVTMARQAYVDPGHSIIIGESFGGLVAIALASENGITGLKGVVNMAGGDGGDYSHLDQPCAPDRLANSLAALGKKNRLPTLWMYSLNDRFWGPLYPQQWFQAFTAAGGRGEFVQLPADKNNGHFIFNRNVLAWHADMERFLSAVAANPATARSLRGRTSRSEMGGKRAQFGADFEDCSPATAGKTGPKWDFSPPIAADSVLPRRLLGTDIKDNILLPHRHLVRHSLARR